MSSPMAFTHSLSLGARRRDLDDRPLRATQEEDPHHALGVR